MADEITEGETNHDRQTAMQDRSSLGADTGGSVPAIHMPPMWQDPLLVEVPAPCLFINSNQRLHRMAKAKLTARWRASAAEALPVGLSQFDGLVKIEAYIRKPRRGRYDPNNLAPTTKACVDGFVDAGLLADDDWNHVIGPDHRHGGIGEPGILFVFELVLKNTLQIQCF